MTPGATFATLRHGLLQGQKHPVFSCQHTHIILLGDIPYPIGRYGVPDRIWVFCAAKFIFCSFVKSDSRSICCIYNELIINQFTPPPDFLEKNSKKTFVKP